MNEKRERAKRAVMALTVRDAQFERVTSNTPRGFGIELRATLTGYREWVMAVFNLGLEPCLNRHHRCQGNGKPAEYIYQIWVETAGFAAE